MKRIRISRLMDEYTDTEFFPAGGSAVNSERVEARVLASVKVQAQKKQMPKKKKVLLAAALAAALVVLAGAGYPYIQHRLVHGDLIFEQKGNERITAFVHYDDVVEYEDGRLIFNRDDGARIDITDLISEETPYIYDGSDPEAGMVYYVIMGGTLEAYGYYEWVQTPYPFHGGGSTAGYTVDFDENGNPVMIISYYALIVPGDIGRSFVGSGSGGAYLEDAMKRPWLLAGAEQLGITFHELPEG